MKSRAITIGIFLSVALVVTAAGLYWMARQAEAGNHHLAISLIRRIQQLESQWSIETARVRSDPFADFDALVTFIPRMERLKAELSDTILSIPSLPEKLASDTGAYLSAIDAKEERVERFKTDYAVLRNSVRYLPLAAASVMQQVEERGGEAAFVRNISSVTDGIHTYLATPVPAEKERLMRVLAELGDGIMSRYPPLSNTIANFVAHGQVLLDKQAPTEEIFQEATSDRITVFGEDLVRGLEAEIVKIEEIVSSYERGILASGGALWLLWLAIALRLPKDGGPQDDSRPASGQPHEVAAIDKIAAAAAPGTAQNGGKSLSYRGAELALDDMTRLTADLMKAEQSAAPLSATGAESAARRIGLEVVAAQMTALAERITSSADILSDLFSDEPESVAEADADSPLDAPPDPLAAHEALKAAGPLVAGIRAEASGIIRVAEHLPSLSRKGDDARASVNINDSINEVVTAAQANTQALVVTDLRPVPDVFASATDIYLLLNNIMDNSVWAVAERKQKKGLIRVETRHEDDGSATITITDNGVGISDGEHKKVFAPFHTSKAEAAGMGLAATRYLVEKYGGGIHMTSLPNQGTMVRVSLPTEATRD